MCGTSLAGWVFLSMMRLAGGQAGRRCRVGPSRSIVQEPAAASSWPHTADVSCPLWVPAAVWGDPSGGLLLATQSGTLYLPLWGCGALCALCPLCPDPPPLGWPCPSDCGDGARGWGGWNVCHLLLVSLLDHFPAYWPKRKTEERNRKWKSHMCWGWGDQVPMLIQLGHWARDQETPE